MLESQLFLNEWGVWFCFLGEPNEGNDKYYQNFKLVFTLKAPADLAYCWNNFGLNNLENFLVSAEGRQKTYPYCNPATRSRTSGVASTPSSTSRRASSPSGKIPTTRRAVDSSSQSPGARRTRINCTSNWCSTCWVKTLSTAATSAASGSSRPRTARHTTEWRSGWISTRTRWTC